MADLETVHATIDHTGITGVGDGSVTSAKARYTGGSITTATSMTNYAAITATGLDMVVAAATGDILLVGLSLYQTNSNTSELRFDVATVVSATLTNFISGGDGTIANSGGIAGMISTASEGTRSHAATVAYAVQAGDISGGNVTLRPVYGTGATSTKTILATTVYPIHAFVVNLG
jgi:hypothetical protein